MRVSASKEGHPIDRETGPGSWSGPTRGTLACRWDPRDSGRRLRQRRERPRAIKEQPQTGAGNRASPDGICHQVRFQWEPEGHRYGRERRVGNTWHF